MTGEYIVTWSMPIEAESAVDAAQQALGIHRDRESIATVFFVERDGFTDVVDLTADGGVSNVTRKETNAWPKIGDFVQFHNRPDRPTSGAHDTWAARDGKVYIVTDTAYDDERQHYSVYVHAKGDGKPDGRWDPDWFVADPQHFTVLPR